MSTNAAARAEPAGPAWMPQRPLQQRVRSAALWAASGKTVGFALRLASNLILTRLLAPETFGLMAIVTALLTGLQLLSDLGVGPGVIQSRRDGERAFLDTAWTLQVLRGIALWGLCLLLALPLAGFYGEPRLALLIAASGFAMVVAGLESMSLIQLQQRLEMNRLALLEIATQVAGTAVSIALAWWFRSVWALVLGWLLGASIKSAASHLLAGAPRHRLCWDREAVGSLYRFGRWIFLTTPLAFLLDHGDRLILGRFLSMEALGLYSIGVLLVSAISDLGHHIGGRVLFPLYAEIGREATPRFRMRVAKIRLALLGTFLPPLWLLAAAGDQVIALLYDSRYAGAGWVTRVMAVGMIFSVIGRIGPIHLARGEPGAGFAATLVPAIALLTSMALGGWLAGSDGLVIGVAAGQVSRYAAQAWIARRYGLWLPGLDVLGFAASALVIGGGLALRSLWG